MDDPTLLVHWLFTVCSIMVMLARLISRRVFFKIFNLGDYLTVAAIICAIVRGGLIHVVLLWGTNNISAAARAKIVFTEEIIRQRTLGKSPDVVNALSMLTFRSLWLQKLVLFHFYLCHYRPMDRRDSWIVQLYIPAFAFSWIAAFIVGFTECDPFRLYWQVVPTPGTCVRAQVQLVVLGVLNIVTDVMLIVLPLPTLISLQTPWRRKFRLYLLCALGLFIIAVTIIRLPINALNASVQANRTIWASTELFIAAIVVNAPILYGAYNKRRCMTRGEGGGLDYATTTTGISRQPELSGLSTSDPDESNSSWKKATSGNENDDELGLMDSIHSLPTTYTPSTTSKANAKSVITKTITTDVQYCIGLSGQGSNHGIELGRI